MKIKILKKSIRQILSKQHKMRFKKSAKLTLSSFCVDELLLAWGLLCPVEVPIPSDWYAEWQSIGGNCLYPYQQVSVANSFMVGMGLCFYFSVSMLGPSLSWTSPSFAHSYSPSLCEVLCTSVSLFPEGNISLDSSIPSGSSNLSVLFSIFPWT